MARDRNPFQVLAELLWKGTDQGLPEEEGQVPSTPHESPLTEVYGGWAQPPWLS